MIKNSVFPGPNSVEQWFSDRVLPHIWVYSKRNYSTLIHELWIRIFKADPDSDFLNFGFGSILHPDFFL